MKYGFLLAVLALAIPSAARAQLAITYSDPFSVTVPATTSTQLIAANTARRALDIIPSTTTCFMNEAGHAATAASKPIPTGWSYPIGGAPKSAVFVYCTSLTTVTGSEAK